MKVKRRQLNLKLTNFQLKLIVESLRELGLNVVLTFMITMIFQTKPTLTQFLISSFLTGTLWYTGYIISKKLAHE